MELSLPLESDRRKEGQEIPHSLQNLEFHFLLDLRPSIPQSFRGFSQTFQADSGMVP
jgi:hypothetical protein